MRYNNTKILFLALFAAIFCLLLYIIANSITTADLSTYHKPANPISTTALNGQATKEELIEQIKREKLLPAQERYKQKKETQEDLEYIMRPNAMIEREIEKRMEKNPDSQNTKQ